ncbi:MAG: polysaccharide biosynthesis protein [Cyanobacteria bacterium RYN_339]|nr:polysaccharide biosynthesis protein [Cyanobacteria bacterium RYN_339]
MIAVKCKIGAADEEADAPHPSHAAPLSSADVTAQARRGVLSLVGRQAVLFPVGFVSGIILARLLSASEFGTYATVSFMVMGAGVLLEVGLGAIVIQQAEDPTPRQLRSIFTAQLLLFGFAALALALVAPWLAAAFHLPPDGTWLVRAMSLHMLLGTLGTNSTLLLERRLGFDVFARIDIANVLLDRGLTLLLAFLHFGAWSFVLGSLAAMTVRVVMLGFAAPWAVGFALDREVLRKALRFGLTLQATNLTALARDNLNVVLGGGFFGPRAVGLLNWGNNLPVTCSHNLVMIVARVSFPAFARLHDDPPARARLLESSLRALNLASYPALLALIPLGPNVVTFLYGETWRPALFALNCFVVRALCTNVTSAVMGYLNATDRAGRALRIAMVWTGLEVIAAAALLPFYGFNGIALGYAVGPIVPTLWLLWEVRREAPMRYGRVFGVPLLAGGAAALAGFASSGAITTLAAFIAQVILTAGAALLVITLFERALLQQAGTAIERRLKLLLGGVD